MATPTRPLIDSFHAWRELSPIPVQAAPQACGCCVQLGQLVLCPAGSVLKDDADWSYEGYLHASDRRSEQAYSGFQEARDAYLDHIGARW